MERPLAVTVVRNISVAMNLLQTKYKIELILSEGEELIDFHQWADEKEQVGVFKIEKSPDNIYYFLFIDWRGSDNFYLVTYPKNKSNPLLELHEIEEYYGGHFELCWSYKPTKRDGRNLERKASFESSYGSLLAEIALPHIADEVEKFLDAIFRLCDERIRADNLSSDSEFKDCDLEDEDIDLILRMISEKDIVVE